METLTQALARHGLKRGPALASGRFEVVAGNSVTLCACTREEARELVRRLDALQAAIEASMKRWSDAADFAETMAGT